MLPQKLGVVQQRRWQKAGVGAQSWAAVFQPRLQSSPPTGRCRGSLTADPQLCCSASGFFQEPALLSLQGCPSRPGMQHPQGRLRLPSVWLGLCFGVVRIHPNPGCPCWASGDGLQRPPKVGRGLLGYRHRGGS